MEPEFLKQQKQKLLQEKERIEKELLSFAEKDPEIKGNYETAFEQIGSSPDDNASEVTNYINDLSVEYSLEDRLQLINKALEKIDKGTYGICSNCNQPIDKKRLEVFPEADICIKCK